MSPGKNIFGVDTIDFLGYRLSTSGITPASDRVSTTLRLETTKLFSVSLI
ncbi:Hypothetical protein FKW44_018817 [Caligus rogercresseyi]|uniref:Uncharacterized protein n=1 Tax=Caligus rogercresseyi TaxID=217165 RepID=A0A7T8GVE5_CALRO|nr:Hypothetical protein FKW44_018817 [Caligus rogercresseyi]